MNPLLALNDQSTPVTFTLREDIIVLMRVIKKKVLEDFPTANRQIKEMPVDWYETVRGSPLEDFCGNAVNLPNC